MRYILFLFFLIPIYLIASPFISLKLSLDYDSNVFTLSDSEFDRFKDGLAFEYIETSDDFTQTLNLRISDNYRLGEFTFGPYLNGSFTNHLQNSDKNSYSFLIGTTTRYEGFFLNTTYGYYPKNYLRKYIDTDGTGQNEDFSYEKMMWRFSSSYRHSRYVIPLAYLKFEQYHYNQYFTEFDAPAWTYGLGWRFLTGVINADVMYYYRTYRPNSDHADIQAMIENDKDGAYESNIYEVKLRTRRYYQTLMDYRIYTNISVEDRYFQSPHPLPINPFHTRRNDVITSISVGTDLWVARNLSFNVDARYTWRNVSSEHQPVINAKEYGRWRIGTSIEYGFGL
jgi:hypothetical protein